MCSAPSKSKIIPKIFGISAKVCMPLHVSYESHYHTLKLHNLWFPACVSQFVVCLVVTQGLITLIASVHLAMLNRHPEKAELRGYIMVVYLVFTLHSLYATQC